MSEQTGIHEHDEPMPEGEEQAPPLTHAMGIVRWFLLIGMTLFALTMLLTYFGATPWANSSQKSAMYHCPMHPTYVSSQPGDCPICGMSLVPIEGDTTKPAATATGNMQMADSSAVKAKPGQYTCPMHPEVISDTAGKCPKCGMFLEQVLADSTSVVAKPGQYTCPMHPEVISDKPGECPKCGMDLELVKEATAPSSGHAEHGGSMGESTVPGLVSVTIEPQRLQLINVRTGTVQKRALGSVTQIVGYVTPDETRLSNVTVRINGWVQKLNVNETGQQVAKGETLLTIYSQDLYQAEQDYLLAYASTLRKGGDSTLASTRSQLLDAARERLSLLGLGESDIAALERSGRAEAAIPLRSPLNGVVLEKSVLAGQAINSSQPLFTIADLSTVWVLADVYESDLAGIRVGQKAEMTVTADPNQIYEGVVSFVYPTVSEQTRTLKVRLSFANPNMKLRPGMYAQVALAGSSGAVLAVPHSAVMDDGKLPYLFVVHGGTHFEPRKITVGRSSDEWAEVLSGVSEGDTVLTSANFLIDSESRLKAAISGMGGAPADEHAGHRK
ncbi:MAG: efflux RND transporter periplasmic adaptor subunit [candidate division Zixibacteria bacterium]|nr:efflux RND transporter periplasmic adaptor subunit [candidate division Zixibacteria bacterium]